MSAATKAWRSIGLPGVVVLGIATAVGSGGGGPEQQLVCGATVTVSDVKVEEGTSATLAWDFDASSGNPALSNISQTSWQWFRQDPAGNWMPLSATPISCPGACDSSDAGSATDPRRYETPPTVFKRDDGAKFKVAITLACASNHQTDPDPVTLHVTAGTTPKWVDVDAQGQSTRPADVAVSVDATASFTAMAFGDNTYQWERSTDGGTTWAAIAGANDWTLDFTNVQQADDAALFHLIATNRTGSSQRIVSRAARLTVNASLFDADFADANWTTTKIYDTTAASGATVTATQQTSGGNPGAFRETTQQWIGGNGVSLGLEAAHLLSSATHDPAQAGAIDHIDFSFDVIILSQHGGATGISIFPLLVQNGQYYQASDVPDGGSPPNLVAWTHEVFSRKTELDFVNINAGPGTGSVNPDFSSSGAPIQFGYGTGNGSATSVPTTTVSGVDNWNVLITLR